MNDVVRHILLGVFGDSKILILLTSVIGFEHNSLTTFECTLEGSLDERVMK